MTGVILVADDEAANRELLRELLEAHGHTIVETVDGASTLQTVRANPPDLLLLDEPTSALDADSREHFLALLFDECRASGAALLFVSHDERLADRFDRRLALGEINRAPTGRGR